MPTPTTRDQAAVPAECCPVLVPREALGRVAAVWRENAALWRQDAAANTSMMREEAARRCSCRAEVYEACARTIDALLAEVGR